MSTSKILQHWKTPEITNLIFRVTNSALCVFIIEWTRAIGMCSSK